MIANVKEINNNNKKNNQKKVFLVLTLNIFQVFFHCFYFDLEQVNISWELTRHITSQRPVLTTRFFYKQRLF